MPLYTFCCDDCQRSTDDHRTIEDRNRPALCECGGMASRAIERPNVQPDLEPYRDPNLTPMWGGPNAAPWVRSRRERRDLMRERGVTEAG